jgi:hypothetical protein
VLAKAVSAGLVEKAGDGFHMAVPVFREADAEILAPAILEVMTPIVRDVVAPVWRDLTRVLDDKGYGHRKDQYQLWRASLTGNVLGEALRFLVEQKVLPRVDEDSPLKWRFVAWKGKLPVADWGMQES